MIQRVILHPKIIAHVKKVCEDSTGQNFSVPRLIDELESFLEKNKGNELIRFTPDTLPEKSTLEDAISSEGKSAGASKALCDLLSLYAFGKDWETVLRSLRSSREKEMQKTEEIKGQTKPRIEDVFRGEIGGMKHENTREHEAILRSIEQLKETVSSRNELDEAEKEYDDSAQRQDRDGMARSLMRLIKVTQERMEAFVAFEACYYAELMKVLLEMKKPEKVIELVDSAFKWNPDFALTNFYAAEAYYETQVYDKLLFHIEKVLSSQPLDIDSLLLQMIYYKNINDFHKVKELGQEAIRSYKEGKLYSTVLTLEDRPLKVAIQKVTPIADAYFQILMVTSLALVELEEFATALSYVDEYIKHKGENILLLKFRVKLLLQVRPISCFMLCEKLIKKHPEVDLFWIIFLRGLVLSGRKKKKVLQHFSEFIRVGKDNAKRSLLNDVVFKSYWTDPDFQKIIAGESPESPLWQFWKY